MVPNSVISLTTKHSATRMLLHLDANAMHWFLMIVSMTTSL